MANANQRHTPRHRATRTARQDGINPNDGNSDDAPVSAAAVLRVNVCLHAASDCFLARRDNLASQWARELVEALPADDPNLLYAAVLMALEQDRAGVAAALAKVHDPSYTRLGHLIEAYGAGQYARVLEYEQFVVTELKGDDLHGYACYLMALAAAATSDYSRTAGFAERTFAASYAQRNLFVRVSLSMAEWASVTDLISEDDARRILQQTLSYFVGRPAGDGTAMYGKRILEQSLLRLGR